MAITRLQLYNMALAFIGAGERIASLSEDIEARHRLDEVWNRGNGAIRYCLEQASWDFAMRTVKLDADADVTPQFGYDNAFLEPSDWVRLDAISANEDLRPPLVDYERERGYIFAFVDPLYLRFVSDDSDYGGDLSLWPESFSRYVGGYLGFEIAPSIVNDIDLEKLYKLLMDRKRDAEGKNAVQGPTRYPPLGQWANARLGSSRRGDRGSRTRLYG